MEKPKPLAFNYSEVAQVKENMNAHVLTPASVSPAAYIPLDDQSLTLTSTAA